MSPDDPRLAARVEQATGRRPARVTPLTGGCIAEVYKIELAGGGALVAKCAPDGGLAEEGRMLADLARLSGLPLPAVLQAGDDLLLMDYVESAGRLDRSAEVYAAELLAALHGIAGPAFGYERDTLIGPFVQPNPWSETWVSFFRDQRLLAMGRRARDTGKLPPQAFRDLETLCRKLERYIDEPAAPALLHGDLWNGNILVRDGRIAAFLDPAIYYGHPEIELAFTTLFGTFGEAFFARYGERRPIAPGFLEARRDLYNLYPLLVHMILFGGSYGASVDRILKRFV